MGENVTVLQNTVMEPIDPSKEQTEKTIASEQDEIAKANLQQQMEEAKKYEDAIYKRMMMSLSLEDIVIAALQKYGNPVPLGKTQNVYYGAQSSIDNGINILAVGKTADEAINNYVAYLTRRNMSQPFKLYPISHTLYEAIACQRDTKKATGLTPRSLLVDGEIDPDTRKPRNLDPYVSEGMVDLMARTYPYPSVASLEYIINKFAIGILANIKDVIGVTLYTTGTIITDTFIYALHTETQGGEDHSTTKGISVIHENVSSEATTINASIVDDQLFRYFHGHCTSIFRQNDASLTTMSFHDLLEAHQKKELFTLTIDISDTPKAYSNLLHVNVQCLFPHADMPPKISVVF